MSGAIKTVLNTNPITKSLGGSGLLGSVAAPAQMDKSPFDITKQAQTAQTQFNPALQAAQANQAAVSPLQTQALTQMGLAATGQGPSLAEMQLRSAQDRGFAQQLAAAQSQRTSSPALAQRQLLLNQGNANRDLAQQSAVQRLQERDAFLNQANQQQQQLGSAVNQNFQLATAPNKDLQQFEMARTGAINQQHQQQAQMDNALTGSLISGGAAVLASDKNVKKDIGSSDSNMRDFLANLNASKFEYKDEATPGAAPGQRYGVMAQDLEKSKVGASLVKNSPTGKQIDIAQGLGAVLAAQATLHDRLEKLEGNPSFGKIVASRSKAPKKAD